MTTIGEAVTEPGVDQVEFGINELEPEAKRAALEQIGMDNATAWEPEWEDTFETMRLLGFTITLQPTQLYGRTVRDVPKEIQKPKLTYSFGDSDGGLFIDSRWCASDIKLDELVQSRPAWKDLHDIAGRLMAFMLRYPSSHVDVNIGYGNNRATEYRVKFNDGRENEYANPGEPEQHTDDDYAEAEKEFGDIESDLMGLLHDNVNEDYEWCFDRTRCEEDAIANEWLFDEDGRQV